LIIVGEGLRHREVDDIADIRFIDSHPKGNGGADNLRCDVVSGKRIMTRGTLISPLDQSRCRLSFSSPGTSE
jgi:hypothetical protein